MLSAQLILIEYKHIHIIITETTMENMRNNLSQYIISDYV